MSGSKSELKAGPSEDRQQVALHFAIFAGRGVSETLELLEKTPAECKKSCMVEKWKGGYPTGPKMLAKPFGIAVVVSERASRLA